MNDNEQQNFSNGPYKASGNLNTVIGNPNININSAITSNIMEDNGSNFSNASNSSSNNNFVNSNTNFNNNNFVNTNNQADSDLVRNPSNIYNTSSNVISQDSTITESKSDPVTDFIRKDKTVLEPNIQSSSNYDRPIDTLSNQGISSSNSFSTDNNSVQYENVYEFDKKKKPKKTIKIPKEFRTAVLVVLILLIVISCFEVVYDFFRNLNLFG